MHQNMPDTKNGIIPGTVRHVAHLHMLDMTNFHRCTLFISKDGVKHEKENPRHSDPQSEQQAREIPHLFEAPENSAPY